MVLDARYAVARLPPSGGLEQTVTEQRPGPHITSCWPEQYIASIDQRLIMTEPSNEDERARSSRRLFFSCYNCDLNFAEPISREQRSNMH